MRTIINIIFLLVLSSCNEILDSSEKSQKTTLKDSTVKELDNNTKIAESIPIIQDKDTSFYLFSDSSYVTMINILSPLEKNTMFHKTIISFVRINNDTNIIFRDTLTSFMRIIEFIDYNGDGIKDLTLVNSSSARSQWTRHLYLIDQENNELIRIKEFENIVDPLFDSINDIICELRLYGGTQRYAYFQINNKELIDLDVSYEDDGTDDGSKYNAAIKKVLKRIKYR